MSDEPITEDWLKGVGFKYPQLERQPSKHWVLWLGAAVADSDPTGPSFTDHEDIGVEVADMRYRNAAGDVVGRDAWFVWFRADSSGRYHRFLHVRHMRFRHELIKLVEAITGFPWEPTNHLYGVARSPRQAARIREQDERLDRRLIRDGHPWSDIERDDTIGRPLPEHLEAYEKAKKKPDGGP